MFSIFRITTASQVRVKSFLKQIMSSPASKGGIDNITEQKSTTTYKFRKDDVNLQKFSEEEKEIYFLHKEACKKGENMYTDPATGYAVFTELFHKERGTCCGNACRHCPFGQENVPKNKRTAKFNSAFYY